MAGAPGRISRLLRTKYMRPRLLYADETRLYVMRSGVEAIIAHIID